jgi:hypothetical protein
MGIPTSEVGYTSVITGRGDHEVHKGHVVALKEVGGSKRNLAFLTYCHTTVILVMYLDKEK